MDIKGLANHFRLKQIVRVPTRKNVTLDLILTNMHMYYNQPQAYPPFGLSDHNTVVLSPKIRDQNANNKKEIIKRDTRKSSKVAMGRYLNSFDWNVLFTPLHT